MNNSKGVVYKRQQLILEYLKKYKTARVDDLSREFSISPITIRRDLELFQEKGIVNRFHGGATLTDGLLDDDPSLSESAQKYELEKHAIAQKAASLVNDRDTIFINSSSTALLILHYLKNKHVIVITNNGKALQVPKDPSVELVLTGGEIYDRKQSMVGEYATHLLCRVTAVKSFLGVGGISANAGITTFVLQETAINELMLKRCSGPTYIVADHSKIGKENNFLSGTISEISCLITDTKADVHQLNLLREKGVDIITVDPLEKN